MQGIIQRYEDARNREKKQEFALERIRAKGAANRQPSQAFGSAGAKTSATSSPAPSEVPYLPESHESGRLGDIMRASPGELQKFYERMPTSEKPIHIIRGTEQSWFNPATSREYGSMRTAMTGFRQRPGEERARASATGGGMTAYQSAQIEQKGEESGFKANQAELEYVNKAVETTFGPMMDMGKMPTEDQLTSVKGKANVEFIEAHYPPEEARKKISKIPIELFRDKKTGEVEWRNAYGDPVMTDEVMQTEGAFKKSSQVSSPEVPVGDFDYRGMTTPGLRTPEPPRINNRKYATKLSNWRKTPGQGLQEIGGIASRLGLDPKGLKSTAGLYAGTAKKVAKGAWQSYADLVNRAVGSQRESIRRMGGNY